MKISIIAVGKMKDAAQKALYDTYAKRLSPAPQLVEIAHALGSAQEIKSKEGKEILKRIDDNAFVIVLDERGQNASSLQLSEFLQEAMNAGKSHIQAILGGAEGLSDEVRARADVMLAFGKMTWPHMLARIMVLEQIYRAKQILAGHPYHREG